MGFDRCPATSHPALHPARRHARAGPDGQPDPLPDVDLFSVLRSQIDDFRSSLANPTQPALRKATASGSVPVTLPVLDGSSWQAWRKTALEALRLEAVYGDLLTGRTSSVGWLECRDPRSPSGDQNPSAGGADGSGDAERGSFHSFRSGESSSIFDFLVENGQATDFKTACSRIAELSGVPLPTRRVDPKALLEQFTHRWAALEDDDSRQALLRTTLEAVLQLSPITRDGLVQQIRSLIGLAQRRQGSSHTVIYMHPDRLLETIERNRERPLAIAAFLHGVGCHELTHADGRMGDGHSEAYVAAREDLGSRTAYLLPQLATIAIRLLKLPEVKDEAVVKVTRLERQLQKVKESRDAARGEKAKVLRQLERELVACRREVEARGAELSAKAQVACSEACGCRSGMATGIPRTVQLSSGPTDSKFVPEDVRQIQAQRVLELVRSGLLQNLPAGITPTYADAFLTRYRGLLLERLTVALERTRPAGESAR